MNLTSKKKLLIPFLFLSYSVLASTPGLGIYIFDEYQNIHNLLKEKEKEDPKASLHLSNAKLIQLIILHHLS